MKIFLLLILSLGLSESVFADSTEGYKIMNYCVNENNNRIQLWKKEHSKSKKWGVRKCIDFLGFDCHWYVDNNGQTMKAVDGDTANKSFINKCNEKR